MQESTKEYIGDWITKLEGPWLTLDRDNVVNIISQEYNSTVVYPEPQNIFRAFHETQFEDTKVIFIGQDPYPNEYNVGRDQTSPYATGIAFGNDSKVSQIAPSLQLIKRSVIDSGYDFNDQTLVDWCKQGVLLLNSSLSVRKGLPGSHKYMWHNFIREFCLCLSNPVYSGMSGLVWVLVGKQAQEFEQYINSTLNHIICVEHPAFAARQNRFWNYEDLFNRINDILIGLYGYDITW